MPDQPTEYTVETAADAIHALLYPSEPEAAKPEPVKAEPESAKADNEGGSLPSPEAAEEAVEAEESAPEAQAEPDKIEAVEAPKAVSEPKKEPETVRKPSEAETAQEQTLSQLNSLVPQLQAAIAGEFTDIKTFADLQKIAADDPGRYNRYVLHQAQLQHAVGEQQRLGAEAQRRFYDGQIAELQKTFPDYVDPVKGPALRAEFTAYAAKSGWDEERMRRGSAADILMMRKAIQWDKAEAAKASEPAKVAEAQAKAKEKAAKAPPVQKPGVATDNDRVTKLKEREARFKKSGHLDDLAALLVETGIAN